MLIFPYWKTLNKIAEVTGVTIDTLLPMLDGNQLITVNHSNSSYSEDEKNLIQKYRQLDADGKEDIDDYIDMKLAKLQRKAEEEELKLG